MKYVLLSYLGQKGKKQDYTVGGTFNEKEINGEDAEVSASTVLVNKPIKLLTITHL